MGLKKTDREERLSSVCFGMCRSGMVEPSRDCIMVTTFEAESSEDIVTQVMPAKLLEVGTAAFKDRSFMI